MSTYQGRHAQDAPEGSMASHRNLLGEQFQAKTKNPMSYNTGKRAKPQATTMGSAELRAQGK